MHSNWYNLNWFCHTVDHKLEFHEWEGGGRKLHGKVPPCCLRDWRRNGALFFLTRCELLTAENYKSACWLLYKYPNIMPKFLNHNIIMVLWSNEKALRILHLPEFTVPSLVLKFLLSEDTTSLVLCGQQTIFTLTRRYMFQGTAQNSECRDQNLNLTVTKLLQIVQIFSLNMSTQQEVSTSLKENNKSLDHAGWAYAEPFLFLSVPPQLST